MNNEEIFNKLNEIGFKYESWMKEFFYKSTLGIRIRDRELEINRDPDQLKELLIHRTKTAKTLAIWEYNGLITTIENVFDDKKE